MNEVPPEEQQTSDAETTRPRRRIWTTVGLTLGAIATLGAVGGAWWAWVFINERLSPWVSDLLTDSLNRPVSLGEVERVSLTGIRFGRSAIPSTETDPDELFINAINVGFNPLQLLSGEITPRISLIGIQGYIEQDETGRWIDTEIDLPEADDEEPLIQISPTIVIEDSELVLSPYLGEGETPRPLTIDNIEGSAAIEQVEVSDALNQGETVEASEVDLELTATPEDSGEITVNGIIQQLDITEDDDDSNDPLNALAANLAIQAQELDLAVLSPAIFASLPGDIPLSITSGTASGNVELSFTPQQAPEITGTASLDDGAIAIESLPNTINEIRGQARFQGDRVALEDFTAEYANLSASLEGFIDTRTGYDLTGEIAPFEVSELVEEFNIDLPVEAAGTFRAEASITGPLPDPRVTTRLLSTDVATIDRVQFANIIAELVYTPAELILSSLEIEPLEGGRLTGSGTYTLSDPAELSLELEGRNLPADAIGRAYGLPDDFTLGDIALDANVSGPLNNLTGLVSWQAPEGTFPTRGTAEIVSSTVRIRDALVQVGGGTISGSGSLAQGQWDADLVAQGIQLGAFEESLQGIIVAGNASLAGTLDDLTLQGIRANGDVTASLRGGTLSGQVALNNGNWNADVQTRNFPVTQFAQGLPVSSINADANLSGTVDDLTLSSISGDGTVSAAIAGGTLTSDIRLNNGFWQAEGQGRNLQLRQFSPELQGTGNTTFQLAGNIDNLSPSRIQGRANITLSDGLATIAGLAPPLAEVRSPLNASIAWDGQQIQVNTLETAGLFASGTVTPRFSGPGAPDIAAVDLALSARDYALSTLPVTFPPALGLAGEATFDGRLTGTPENLNLAGTARLTNLALNDLVFDPLLAGDVQFSSQEGLDVSLLGQNPVAGQRDEISFEYTPQPRQLNFRVEASEAIAIGTTEGDQLRAEVYNFPISALNLPPAGSTPYGPLRGEITFATASVNLDTLNTDGQVIIEDLGLGQLGVDRFFAGFGYNNGVLALNNGEIRMVDRNPRGVITESRLYRVSGRYALNQTPEIQASLSTEEGELQDILEILNIAELADLGGVFTPEESIIPASEAEATSLLGTPSVGDRNDTILSQLRRLYEIRQIEIQESRQMEMAMFPPLSELQGSFSGEVDLTATLPDEFNVAFDLEGQSWQWGNDLQADVVVARGRYADGLISLNEAQGERLRFESTEGAETAYIDLTGAFSVDPDSPQSQGLELEVVNLPAEKIAALANLPFDLNGRLNGNAALNGRLSDPELAGNIELLDGTLNRQSVRQAEAEFTYAGARLDLDANLRLVDANEPLVISASIPYQPDFVERSPTSRNFSVEANVQNEGFAILDLLIPDVSWEGGQGDANLSVAGFWLDGAEFPLPTEFDGFINLDGATISFGALPDPLTDITGEIRLDPTTLSIVVDDLMGQFSDGELVARGTFPILSNSLNSNSEASDTPEEEDAAPEEAPSDEIPSQAPPTSPEPAPETPITQTPLSLTLDNITLNLKGLYSGQVNGRIVVGGGLFRTDSQSDLNLGSLGSDLELVGPQLTGEIDLSDGTITIPEGSSSTSTASSEDGFPVRFSNLDIVLANDIRIVQGALINVAGRGGLRLDGNLVDPRPSGIIRLPSGRLELFATTLTLAGSNDRAEFRGDFDPILDVTLQTSLPEADGSDFQPTTSPFPPNEIPETTIDDLIVFNQLGSQLVRITARYTGPASEIGDLQDDLNNLVLTSSPPRSTNEIISLLSGNVLGAFNSISGGSAVPFATIAGSALLGRIQQFLGDTIPISVLRIFPVNSNSGQVNDSQEIGAEIGFNVRPNISVSVLRVITDSTSPTQFNVRYRIDDRFTLRGTTSFQDFQEQSGVLLEYETRF